MKKIINLSLLVLFTLTSLLAHNGDDDTKKINTSKSTVQWLGKKITGEHTGKVGIESGELVFNQNALVGGAITINMASITVEDLQGEWGDKLKGHLTSDDFFGIANHPTAKLIITNVAGSGNSYNITADLTIKGKTAPITFEASINGNTANAEIVIDRTVYDIRYGSGKFFDNLGDKTIYDDFTLTVNLSLD
jgi:polyisoprenoid-binding protein YceI